MSLFQRLQDLMPSRVHAGKPERDRFAGSRFTAKDLQKTFGKKKRHRVELNRQCIYAGVSYHGLHNSPVYTIRFVELCGQAQVPRIG